MVRRFLPLLVFAASASYGAVLDLPSNAAQTREEKSGAAELNVPTAPFNNGKVPGVTFEGQLTTQAWRIDAAGITSLQLLDPLRTQLLDAGFEITFECRDTECGGFDFRFALDLLPAPDMFVSLGDFYFLSATKEDEAVTLLTSRSSTSGYLQISHISPDGATPFVDSDAAPARQIAVSNSTTDDIIASLEAKGFAILGDLTFETGSSNLGEIEFPSLQILAEYLLSNPNRRVGLVGHTDSEGSLDGNIALSKRRASAVLERLVSRYNIPRAQLEAEGMGYLSPIASNLTEEGRQQNRRVEVIITSTN
ncbi:OmpA family protein [Nereida sp. MMG025]|uniref:OmpA family protein n=1 Tax=Nereida sp. MMG025 TaxID=2909981 RepID=UPI001F3E1366|nr:OmpA family protein [Nereida sp. MMG025]MCF6444437.1 OmpA family protein [Nereida sp. MMG025]